MNSRPFALPSLRALAVTGADAQAFLQNQLSSDLGEVSAERGQLSAWHDPKGRVLAVLRILPAPNGYLLVMQAELLDAVAKRLRMFVLRAKVALGAGPPVYGMPPAPGAGFIRKLGMTPGDAPLSAACNETASVLRLPGEAGWLIAGALEPAETAADQSAVTSWERAEIEAGIPEVYPQTSGEFVAQMINLDRIGAVSFTKGCYPGQEIVARAHHLGRVKRRARVFRLPGPPPAPGVTLEDPAGTVVRAASLDGESLVMVVVADSGPDS
jgi:tRNA-modifying protein YgfZ